jgi:hypothetical protein
MSPDHHEPAPPLQPEDLALETSLPGLRPRVASTDFLDRLLYHLELAASDEAAVSAAHSPPMPLDASLLAFEHELRSLRPVDMDFPTGQRVLRALEAEMPSSAPAFKVLDGSSRPDASRRRWAAATPWATAAALVAAAWVVMPHIPRPGTGPVVVTHASLIPFAGEKGSVIPVFPDTPRSVHFGSPHGQLFAGDKGASSMRFLSIPEAPAPQAQAELDVRIFNLPDEYRHKLGITHGVAINDMGPGGPASTHGLEIGDIILRLNGAPVSSTDELSVMIKNSAPGSVVTLQVLRGRLIGDIRVRLGTAPSA